nr:reverse transcriptase domain, reverse transcriptase zinc-binding domain protein [Tanacetum cinerariifolium]
MHADHKNLFCSFVYADNYYIDRRVLWSNLVGHAIFMRNRPWVLLGDFNVALNLEDHSTGGYEPNAAMRDFKECVQAMKPYRISDHSPCVIHIPTLDEERFLKQKATIDWLKAGDSNTAYFHKFVKSKCVRNRIEMVSDASINFYDGNQVLSAFVNHYNQFLGAEGITIPLDNHDLFTSVLDDAKADFMVHDVSNDEFKSVIFLWGMIGLLALTVLLPLSLKKHGMWVKEGLGDIVSVNQSAFVPGRRISDNILLMQELMRNYHRRRGPPRAAYSICVNGNLHGWFQGLRQGDPLSPCLFTLVMEILTLILQRRVLGLVPSITKSTAFFCNVPNTIKASILNSMPFAEGVWPVSLVSSFHPSSCYTYVLVFQQKLKIQDRLRQRDVGLSIDLNLLRCPLCNLVPDSHDHLFFECVFSSQVWSKVCVLYEMDSILPQLIDVTTFITPISKGKTVVSILSRLVLAATSYYIWLETNEILFKKKTSSPYQFVDVIISMVRLKLVTFKFKKMSTGSRLLLDQ